MTKIRGSSDAVDTDQQLLFESENYSQSFSGTRAIKREYMNMQ